MNTKEQSFTGSRYATELSPADAAILRESERQYLADQMALDLGSIAMLGFSNATGIKATESLRSFEAAEATAIDMQTKERSREHAIGARALSHLVQKDTQVPYDERTATGYALAA